MASAEYVLLTQGDWTGAISLALSNLFGTGLGLFWVLLGLLIWGAVLGKTRSLPISSIIFIIYSVIAVQNNLIAASVQLFMALLIAVMLGATLISIFLNRGK